MAELARRVVGLARRLIVVAAGVVVVLLATAGTAAALPGLPGIPDCKSPPSPIPAGSGISGMLDPGPVPPAAPADPFTDSSTTTIYAQYGYAGLHWSTYDLGCLGQATNVGAEMDTMLGNWQLGLAVFLVGAANGLHAQVMDPTWMEPLDQVTASVTMAVHDAIWEPWGLAGLLGVVVLLLVYSARGQLSDTLRGAAWALLVLTVLAGVVNYPRLAGDYYDQIVIGSLAGLDSTAAGSVSDRTGPGGGSGGSDGSDGSDGTDGSADGYAALLVDTVLYPAWLRGEVGSATGDTATRWGPTLFGNQALTYDEVSGVAADPATRAGLDSAKGSAWQRAAQEVQDGDPGAYTVLQGDAGGRAAAGALALFAASTTSLFRIVADLFLAAGLVTLRVLVMLFPAVAVLGVMVVFSGLVRRLANAAGAAVINVLAFGAASVLHTTIVTAALQHAEGGLAWMSLVLCLLVTVVLFVLCLPLLSLTALAGTGGRSGWAAPALRGAFRLAGASMIHRRLRPPPGTAGQPDGQAPPGAEDEDGDGLGPPGQARRRTSRADLSQLRRDEHAPAVEPVRDDGPNRVRVTAQPWSPGPVREPLPYARAARPAVRGAAGRGFQAVEAGPSATGVPALPGRSRAVADAEGLDGVGVRWRPAEAVPQPVTDRYDHWHASNLDSSDVVRPQARAGPSGPSGRSRSSGPVGSPGSTWQPRPLIWDPRTGRAVPAVVEPVRGSAESGAAL